MEDLGNREQAVAEFNRGLASETVKSATYKGYAFLSDVMQRGQDKRMFSVAQEAKKAVQGISVNDVDGYNHNEENTRSKANKNIKNPRSR